MLRIPGVEGQESLGLGRSASQRRPFRQPGRAVAERSRRPLTRRTGGDEEAALPSTFVFDASGRLQRVFRGAITESDLDPLLESFRDEGESEPKLRLLAETYFAAADFETAARYYRRLVDLQGGRAWAESEVGQGSTFSVAFPVANDAPTDTMERTIVAEPASLQSSTGRLDSRKRATSMSR